MKHLKITYLIKALYILHISFTVSEVSDWKAFLLTLSGIFFLHSFWLIVNREERMAQDNYFLKCKWFYLKILICCTQLSFQVYYEGLLYVTGFEIHSCPGKTPLLVQKESNQEFSKVLDRPASTEKPSLCLLKIGFLKYQKLRMFSHFLRKC